MWWRQPKYAAILELERFTGFRKAVGDDLADRLLATIAQRASRAVGGSKVRSHRGGTIQICFRAADSATARDALQRCQNLLEAVEIDGIAFSLHPKIAFAEFSRDMIETDLFGRLSSALFDPERSRDRLVYLDGSSSDSQPRFGLPVLRELSRCISERQFLLHYQPKLDCRTGDFKSVEALIRLPSAKLAAYSTQSLVELAECTGVIDELTLAVLDTALRDQVAMRQAGHDLTVYINLSGLLLPNHAFNDQMMRTIRDRGGRIGIEVTETAVVSDPQAAFENVSAYASANVPVAIDDFGSGFSSLSYLKHLPAQELKIDGTFIAQFAKSHRDPLIVRAAIDLAHALEMEITAEGVDEPMTFALLRAMGCDFLQGYYIAQPLPIERLVKFLAQPNDHLERSVGARRNAVTGSARTAAP